MIFEMSRDRQKALMTRCYYHTVLQAVVMQSVNVTWDCVRRVGAGAIRRIVGLTSRLI